MQTKMELPIYLDAAATTPVHPEVLDAMLPYFTQHFGNANSQHIYGQIAKKAIDDARQSIADHINVLAEEIIFTSGATEAINLAIKGFWEANRDKGNHIITVKTEHKAVLNTCAYLETLGVDVTYLDVDHYGRITNDQLKAAFRSDTILVSVMHVNNETGLVLDIHSFAEACADRNIAFLTDSTQAIGHIETDYSNTAISMACISSHKIQGPKGMGALVKKQACTIQPQIIGGNQEKYLRAGSLNTPGIVGLQKALELSKQHRFSPKHVTDLLKNEITYSRLIPERLSAPHIVTLKIENWSDSIEKELSVSYSFSRGSACNSGLMSKSHVFEAIGRYHPNSEFIRFSADLLHGS